MEQGRSGANLGWERPAPLPGGQVSRNVGKNSPDYEQNELGQEPENPDLCESRPSTGTSPVVMLDDLSFPC